MSIDVKFECNFAFNTEQIESLNAGYRHEKFSEPYVKSVNNNDTKDNSYNNSTTSIEKKIEIRTKNVDKVLELPEGVKGEPVKTNGNEDVEEEGLLKSNATTQEDENTQEENKENLAKVIEEHPINK